MTARDLDALVVPLSARACQVSSLTGGKGSQLAKLVSLRNQVAVEVRQQKNCKCFHERITTKAYPALLSKGRGTRTHDRWWIQGKGKGARGPVFLRYACKFIRLCSIIHLYFKSDFSLNISHFVNVLWSIDRGSYNIFIIKKILYPRLLCTPSSSPFITIGDSQITLITSTKSGCYTWLDNDSKNSYL